MPTAPLSRNELDLARIDWSRVDTTTDEEIARQAAEDPDTAPVLTPAQLRTGRRITPEAVEDVRALRTGLGLSQEAFAARFGFSVDAVRQYESRRRVPTGPARALLRVIACAPDVVTRALAGRQR